MLVFRPYSWKVTGHKASSRAMISQVLGQLLVSDREGRKLLGGCYRPTPCTHAHTHAHTHYSRLSSQTRTQGPSGLQTVLPLFP